MTNDKVNRLVAEKVMGLKLYTDSQGCEMWESYWPNSQSRNFYIAVDKYRPATDAHQALLALEKASAGRCWVIAKALDGEFLAVGGAHDKPFRVNAKTVALAACLCALKASGLEVETDG